jgi:flagellar biosynthesis/type III secretory pathway protein FliH
MEEPALRRAKEALETLSADPEARLIAERRAVGMRLYRADIAGTREDALAEGEAIGRAKGEADGLAKGEAVGLAKGEADGLAKGEAVGLAKGEAAGVAKAVVNVLRRRGLVVDSAFEERVRLCTDLAQLESWLERAVHVERPEQIFEV